MPLKSRGAAQIALTGDEEFVRIARLAAARHGMYLGEYGLWGWHTSEEAALEHESQSQSVFEVVNIEFRIRSRQRAASELARGTGGLLGAHQGRKRGPDPRGGRARLDRAVARQLSLSHEQKACFIACGHALGGGFRSGGRGGGGPESRSETEEKW